MEAEVREETRCSAAGSEDGRGGAAGGYGWMGDAVYMLRNAGGLQKLKESRNHILLWSLQKECSSANPF